MLEFRLKDVKEVIGLINDLSHDDNMKEINVKKIGEYFVLNVEFKEE